jgi:sulfur carrier protein ThiS
MVSLDEILQRIVSFPSSANCWAGLVIPPEQQQQALQELEESIPIFTDEPVKVLSADTNLEELIKTMQISQQEYIVLWQFDAWSAAQWQALDYARSQFNRPQGGIFLLTPQAVELLTTQAPNFASWIGSSIYNLQLGTEVLTAAECQQRLVSLQQWADKTDAEIIQLAERGQLPRDPQYGEWLILLGRGDLID